MTPQPGNEDRPIAALLAPDILLMLDESPSDIGAETEEMHPANLADVAATLEPDKVRLLLRVLPPARAADVLEYLDEELRTGVLEAMSSTQAAALVAEMTPDDRADVLEELDEEHADEILSKIAVEARGETERLLAYPPESAGGLMTTEFVSIPEGMTVDVALRGVRNVARAGRREALYTIYATDPGGRVRGVLSLRELLAAAEGTRIEELAWTDVVSVRPSADREEVARVTSKYDLVAVPVVDDTGRILGVVTVDDVIDAIVEEQTEDMQKFGGMEALEQPYFAASFWGILRKRGGWLVLLFIEEIFTGIVLRHHSALLQTSVALMFYVPLIISSGGNSGSQSATLITRALAVGDVRLRDTLRVFARELGQGLALGAFLGAIGFGRALMWGNGTAMAWVVALTLLAVVLTGTIVGAMLPLVFTRIRIDPAIASSPFVASFVDVAGVLIYFTVAQRMIGLGGG